MKTGGWVNLTPPPVSQELPNLVCFANKKTDPTTNNLEEVTRGKLIFQLYFGVLCI